MKPEAISILAIIIAAAIGFMVDRYYRNQKHRDYERERNRLMRAYAEAQRMHRPSEHLWRDLRDTTTEQLRQEIA